MLTIAPAIIGRCFGALGDILLKLRFVFPKNSQSFFPDGPLYHHVRQAEKQELSVQEWEKREESTWRRNAAKRLSKFIGEAALPLPMGEVAKIFDF